MFSTFAKTAAAVRSWLAQEPSFEKATPGNRLGSAVASDNSEDIARLKTIITNTYAAALIDLRTNKSIIGDNARTIAYAITAKTVGKSMGRRIDPGFVKQVIMNR